MANDERYQQLLERYQSGQVPWDDTLPPPELMALADGLPPGRALDLGCGYGRGSIYLAQLGWQVAGVDFVETAVAGARQRAEAAGVAEQIVFYDADVTRLDFLTEPFDLVFDVGCMHSLPLPDAQRYGRGVSRLTTSGGTYLLFAHLRDEEETDEELRWAREDEILALFADAFTLEKVERGWTQVEDKPAWRSAWFWFRRR